MSRATSSKLKQVASNRRSAKIEQVHFDPEVGTNSSQSQRSDDSEEGDVVVPPPTKNSVMLEGLVISVESLIGLMKDMSIRMAKVEDDLITIRNNSVLQNMRAKDESQVAYPQIVNGSVKCEPLSTSLSSELKKADQNAKLYAHIILSIVSFLSKEIEQKQCRMFASNVGEKFTTLTRLIQVICANNQQLVLAKALHTPLIVEMFGTYATDNLTKVNHSTMSSMRDNSLTRPVYKSLVELLPKIKPVAEVMPYPFSAILRSLGNLVLNRDDKFDINLTDVPITSITDDDDYGAGVAFQHLAGYYDARCRNISPKEVYQQNRAYFKKTFKPSLHKPVIDVNQIVWELDTNEY